MRILMIAGAVIALIAADGAAAQVTVHRGAGYPPPGAGPMRPMAHHGGANRWGSKIGGRWWGGANAPGGWRAYRRPARGYALPRYWVSPRFYVTDWAGYGLAAPQPGYNWVRYYDDAVLIDSRGSVFDSADGIDWDEYRDGSDAGLDYSHDVRPPPPRHGPGADYPPPGADYGPDDAGNYPLPPPPPYRGPHHDRGGTWVSPDGLTTVTTTNGYIDGSRYYGGGYGGTTTVTVETAPAITTTTTEIYEDRVTYSRPHRKVWHKKVWRPKTKVRCACGS